MTRWGCRRTRSIGHGGKVSLGRLRCTCVGRHRQQQQIAYFRPVRSLASGRPAKFFYDQFSHLGPSRVPPVVVPTGQLSDESVSSSTTQRLEEVGKTVGDIGNGRGCVRVRLTAVCDGGFRAGRNALRRTHSVSQGLEVRHFARRYSSSVT